MSQTQNKFAIHEAAREGNASIVESLLSVSALPYGTVTGHRSGIVLGEMP